MFPGTLRYQRRQVRFEIETKRIPLRERTPGLPFFDVLIFYTMVTINKTSFDQNNKSRAISRR